MFYRNNSKTARDDSIDLKELFKDANFKGKKQKFKSIKSLSILEEWNSDLVNQMEEIKIFIFKIEVDTLDEESKEFFKIISDIFSKEKAFYSFFIIETTWKSYFSFFYRNNLLKIDLIDVNNDEIEDNYNEMNDYLLFLINKITNLNVRKNEPAEDHLNRYLRIIQLDDEIRILKNKIQKELQTHKVKIMWEKYGELTKELNDLKN